MKKNILGLLISAVSFVANATDGGKLMKELESDFVVDGYVHEIKSKDIVLSSGLVIKDNYSYNLAEVKNEKIKESLSKKTTNSVMVCLQEMVGMYQMSDFKVKIIRQELLAKKSSNGYDVDVYLYANDGREKPMTMTCNTHISDKYVVSFKSMTNGGGEYWQKKIK